MALEARRATASHLPDLAPHALPDGVRPVNVSENAEGPEPRNAPRPGDRTRGSGHGARVPLGSDPSRPIEKSENPHERKVHA